MLVQIKNIKWFQAKLICIFALILPYFKSSSQSVLPRPDHIVVVMLENYGYAQIIGSSYAPNINFLANDSHSALFIHSYAIEHPSQPNYLDLYSGCNQGVVDDKFPGTNPFTTANLGRQLIDSGKTFITYSEDLPSVGYNGNTNGLYARKHNPAANWMGTGKNQIPATTNQPFTAFPSNDFTLLPTVSFVIPNLISDMHNGTDPNRIAVGDAWIQNNLATYINWANTHNSLLILTFDEDDNYQGNHIATIFTGQMVKQGVYSDTINHYTVLRTIEDIYKLPYACNAATAVPIKNCWASSIDLNDCVANFDELVVYPNPANGKINIKAKNACSGKLQQLEIYNVFGEKVMDEMLEFSVLKPIDVKELSAGIYFVKVYDGKKSHSKKFIVQ